MGGGWEYFCQGHAVVQSTEEPLPIEMVVPAPSDPQPGPEARKVERSGAEKVEL